MGEENLEPSSAKKRRLPVARANREISSANNIDDDISTHEKTLSRDLVVYDRHSQCFLTDGEYELVLTECSFGEEAQGNGRRGPPPPPPSFLSTIDPATSAIDDDDKDGLRNVTKAVQKIIPPKKIYSSWETIYVNNKEQVMPKSYSYLNKNLNRTSRYLYTFTRNVFINFLNLNLIYSSLVSILLAGLCSFFCSCMGNTNSGFPEKEILMKAGLFFYANTNAVI